MLASHLLRTSRLFQTLNPRQAAKLVGVTPEHYGQVEAGKYPPGRLLAVKLQHHFGVAIEAWPAR